MSRSNGPASQAGGWPPPGRPLYAEQDPHTQPPHGQSTQGQSHQSQVPPTRPPRQGHIVQPQAPQGQPYPGDPRQAPPPAASAYPDPQGYGGYDAAPTGGGYAYPGAGEPAQSYDPYAAAGLAGQSAPVSQHTAVPQHHTYAPQFDPYMPAQGYPAPHPAGQSYGAQRAPSQSVDAALSQLGVARQRAAAPGDFAVPPPATSDYAAEPRGRGYDQWQAPPAGIDAHGYDLGGYQSEPRTQPRHAAAMEPPFAQPQPQAPRYVPEPPPPAGYGFEANAPAPRYGEPAPPFGSASQGFEPQLGLEAHGGFAQPHGQPVYDEYSDQAYAQSLADGKDGGEYEHDGHEEYEEEPPRRGRMLYAAAALGLAIVVGGGLAFAYQKFFRSSGTQTATPVIKEKSGPSKIKPSEPGGKQFAHRDSKMMDRLSSASTTGSTDSSASAANDAEGGTRRVQTLVVTRDGSIAPPPASQEPAGGGGQSGQSTINVPGLTVVDGFGNRPQPRSAPASPPPQEPIVVNPPSAPAAKPIVVAKAAPAAPTAVDASDVAEPPAKPVRPAAAPAATKRPVPKKIAAATPAPPARTGAGYVAVLASVPVSSSSRMDALKQFADLQQKYGSALQGRMPDVQEADLGQRGKYHRLLAGPPGSRDQANGVCAQLKAAGYPGCWILGY